MGASDVDDSAFLCSLHVPCVVSFYCFFSYYCPVLGFSFFSLSSFFLCLVFRNTLCYIIPMVFAPLIELLEKILFVLT
jgi:hypothetical protein